MQHKFDLNAFLQGIIIGILLVFFMVMVARLFAYIAESDDHYQECERYEAARIPQDMNPCWGSVKR
jgi:hypothetical protein